MALYEELQNGWLQCSLIEGAIGVTEILSLLTKATQASWEYDVSVTSIRVIATITEPH